MKRKEVNGLTFEEWLNSRFVPLAGRESGGGDGGGGDGGDGGAGDGGSGDGGDGSGDGAPAGDGGDGGDGSGEGEENFVRMTQEEAAQLRRENAAFKRKASEAERRAKADGERQKAEQGRWEELANERSQEIAEANDAREAAEYELDQYRREVRVIGIAQKMGFNDPRDAILHLTDDETADEETTKRSLTRLGKEKKYLLNPRAASGGASGGSGAGGGLTMEQISNMSPDEVNARWAEVQEAMKASA